MTSPSTGIAPRAFEALLSNLMVAPPGQDFCLNGLQLDAGEPIRSVLGAVSISDAVIDRAIEVGAQAIVVHHGWHWKGEDARIVNARGDMTRKLIKAGISLLAYHQPLDQSPICGNNIALALKLGLIPIRLEPNVYRTVCNGAVLLCRIPEDSLLKTAEAIAMAFNKLISEQAGAANNQVWPTVLNSGKAVRRVAVCTGGAQRLFDELQSLPDNRRPDLYITGEISLPQYYTAKSTGMAYLAGGHHNTEIFGIQMLMAGLNNPEWVQSVMPDVHLTAEFFNDWCPV